MPSDNLKFAILRFRFPPLSCILEGPIKLYKTVPVHLDSALAAAELLTNIQEENENAYGRVIQLSLEAGRGIINPTAPKCLAWSDKKPEFPLCSVLIPIYSIKDGTIKLLLPSEKRFLFHVILDGEEAKPFKIEGLENIVDFHNLLPLRRRANLERLAQMLVAGNISIKKRGLSEILESSGSYRAINSRVRLNGELSVTTFAVIMEVKNEKMLCEYLNFLKTAGVGKKRDMGYGDLIDYQIYKLMENEDINLNPQFVEWAEKELKFRITLRLLPWFIIDSWLNEESWRILQASMMMASPRSPYWSRRERTLCALPFSIFIKTT